MRSPLLTQALCPFCRWTWAINTKGGEGGWGKFEKGTKGGKFRNDWKGGNPGKGNDYKGKHGGKSDGKKGAKLGKATDKDKTTFQGYCSCCSSWSHRWVDCPTRPAIAVTTMEGQAAEIGALDVEESGEAWTFMKLTGTGAGEVATNSACEGCVPGSGSVGVCVIEWIRLLSVTH